MECTYTGNFLEKHNNKKRRMVGPAKEKAAKLLCENGISGQSYRELEANRIVKIGIYYKNVQIINILQKHSCVLPIDFII